MNKKSILITAILILTAGAIGTIIYTKNQPKPLTTCEILINQMLAAKDKAEHNFAEKRWTDTCITNQP